MRGLNRNMRKVYYCNHSKTEYTKNGTVVSYSDAKSVKASVSASKGISQTELFGNLQNYDKTMIVHDANCPIDENTVLFVDKLPEFDEDGAPLNDYVIVKVARSLNAVAYAISKVSTNG
jgi:hypothetical protein